LHYLVRRLLFYLLTAWAAITLNFVLPRLMPGNPMQVLVARAPGPLSPSAVKSLAVLFGFRNSSFWDQYLRYWSQLFHGNLGISFTYFPVPVVTIIAQDLPWTVALIGLCTMISFLVGTCLGMDLGFRGLLELELGRLRGYLAHLVEDAS
jgi:peptide/nickel transport system permease protein